MSQSMRSTSTKVKRSTKEREKRKSVAGNPDNSIATVIEKSSPTRDSHLKRYAGLSVENIKVAAEHITNPDSISEESCEILAEDLNYKLRYIIHQAANRAFISNRTGINSKDIDETFEDLQLDKVFGAPLEPSWIPIADQNYLFLDDPKVNMLEEIEEKVAFSQPQDPVVLKSWLPELKESNHSFKNYFKIICQAVVSNDMEMRKMALQNISTNPNIGPIINWFYKFGYLLLSKDVTYDSLTLNALDLIETLEMSPLGNLEANESQLKLLVRLMLQRLLKSHTNSEVLKPMCWILAILCRRKPLNEFVMTKLKQKLPELSVEYLLPFLMLVNALGIDAIISIFVENFELLHSKLNTEENMEISPIQNGCDLFTHKKLFCNWKTFGFTVMEMYYVLFKNDIFDKSFSQFPQLENFTILLNKPQKQLLTEETKAMDFIKMKKELIKTRRKLELQHHRRFLPYESVFEVPVFKMRMKQKMENHYKTNYHIGWKKQSYVVIGKTSLLLPIMRVKNSVLPHCYDHSLFSYNL